MSEDEHSNEQEKAYEEAANRKKFFFDLIKALGINTDKISSVMDDLEKAENEHDAQKYLDTLHVLLNCIGESSLNAAPEINRLKKELVGILHPIVDVIFKDTLIDLYAYTANIEIEALDKTIDIRKEMNGRKATLLSDQVARLQEAGFSRKEALELVKAEIMRPQSLSLSLPTGVPNNGQNINLTREQIIEEFIKIAQTDPDILKKALLPMLRNFRQMG